jgi:hypothetical protein
MGDGVARFLASTAGGAAGNRHGNQQCAKIFRAKLTLRFLLDCQHGLITQLSQQRHFSGLNLQFFRFQHVSGNQARSGTVYQHRQQQKISGLY